MATATKADQRAAADSKAINSKVTELRKAAEKDVCKELPGSSRAVLDTGKASGGGIHDVKESFEGPWEDHYSGKTTVAYHKRTDEHTRTQKSSSVYKHREKCRQCSGTMNFKMSFIEDYKRRGKYTLSEREYLWKYRIKGVINDQKTLVN